MRHHLPECYVEGSTDSCICGELRACRKRVLRDALELAERQASESHNDSWNRAVAAVVQAIADEIEEADAYAQAWK